MTGIELSLPDRTVVVVGAGGDGIGCGVSALLVRSGATVLGLDIDRGALAITEGAVEEGVERVAGEERVRFVPALADATDAAAVEHALTALDGLPPLHGLVHVVGGMPIGDWSSVVDMPPETFARVVALNLQSTFVSTQAVARRLVDADADGAIVLLSSISGVQAMPFGAPYAAAKAGILAFARTAALELAPRGIRVNAVAPGTIRGARVASDTPAEQAAIPLGRRGAPDDVAGAVLYLLSDLAGFVTGHTLVVDGGSSARPSFLDADDLPVFVADADLRARLLQPG
jgi:NAD(P)-dependent dehydrogenase (short-subunit alcohol dehydrogenase family)